MSKPNAIEAVSHPNFSHARTGNGIMRGLVHVYHRADSPTGVKLFASYEADDIEPALRSIRSTSPLSPTEGLSGPRGW